MQPARIKGAQAWLAAGLAVVALLAVALCLRQVRAQEESVREARAHRQKGIEFFYGKAYPDAEEMLQRAMRADPDDWEAPYHLGLVQIELKQFALAVPYLETALSLNPGEVKILTAIGVCFFKLGRVDMARGYFWAAFAANPANADARGLVETMAKLQWRAESTGAEATGHAPKH